MFLYDYGQREEDNVCDIRLNGNVPDEQAFESIKSGVDALPPGAKMILNSGEHDGDSN